ncbi:MAG: hypothetical protein ACRC92_20360 [Peptostreptococcaceae bacterium]
MREIWINNKNKNEYIVLNKDVTNATNKDDGTPMVLYISKLDPSKVYVRESEEFNIKFTKKA